MGFKASFTFKYEFTHSIDKKLNLKDMTFDIKIIFFQRKRSKTSGSKKVKNMTKQMRKIETD